MSVAYLVVYLIAAAGGFYTLTDPPLTTSPTLGPILGVAWGWAMLAGGTIAAAVVLRGTWWVERIGILLILTGLAMYLGAAIQLHWDHAPGQARSTQIPVTAIAALCLAIRFGGMGGRPFSQRAAAKARGAGRA